MTTITDKVTQYLNHLNGFSDTNGTHTLTHSEAKLYLTSSFRISAASDIG